MVLAFADASVVVLALPAMYGEYGTSIVGVSWVITSYAVVVAVAGFALAAVGAGRPFLLTLAGLAAFAGSSAWCALASSLGSLVAGRCLQGLGGALLLVGSNGVLHRLSPTAGRRVWAAAGTVGLAVGPALGGVLTEWFEWRAIFAVQAPVAALAMVVAFDRRARQAPPVAVPEAATPSGAGRLASAGLGLLGVSGALVGALFLGVLLVIEVWQYSPIGGAVVVSALPAGAVAAGALRRRAGPAVRAASGSVLLALGLLALAMLPEVSAWWAAAALAVCGAGFGLATGVLDAVAGADRGEAGRTGALAIGWRHAGLVLGLVLVAPVLAADLEEAQERAAVTGAATILDARLDVRDKIKVARALRDEVERTPRGEMPDLRRPFAGVDTDRSQVGAELRHRIQAVLTRAFRGGFLVAAALALAAAVPAVLLGVRAMPFTPVLPGRLGVLSLAVLVVAGGALVVGEVSAGGRSFGSYRERDPCGTSANPYPGRGLDAVLQRILLGGLDGAACELGTSREQLVLSLEGDTGLGTVQWDRATIERAVGSGLVRAVDDAKERGALPAWAARPLRAVAERAPVTLLLGTVDWVRDSLDAISRGVDRLLDVFRR